MKAIQLVGRGQLEYREVPEPTCGEDDIIIEVKAVGICGSDLHFVSGELDPSDKYPFTMGHEFAGVIAERGINVDPKWKVGDRVVSENTGDACGYCSACAKGNYVMCRNREVLGCSMDGGYTKYVKIPGKLLKFYKNCLWHIPENLSYQEATLGDPAANAYHAVIQQGNLRPGETVVVYGVGALGLMSIAMARIGGAANIIAIGMHSDRLTRESMARHYGASYFLCSDEEENMAGKVMELAGGPDGVALTIDAVGHPSCLKTALQFTRNEGTIVRIGLSHVPFNGSLDLLTMNNIKLQGHMGYNQESWRNILEMAKNGILDLKTIISCELPMKDYKRAFEMTKNQEAAKVILIPE